MEEPKYLNGYDVIGKLYEEQNEEGLFDFILFSMEELIKILNKTFSKPVSEKKLDLMIEKFMSYAFEYKVKSFEELATDLCTLLCLFEIINSLTE